MLNYPAYAQAVRQKMPKSAFRGCIVDPINLGGIEIPQYARFADGLSNCNEKIEHFQVLYGPQSQASVDTKTEILEPSITLTNSEVYIFWVPSLWTSRAP